MHVGEVHADHLEMKLQAFDVLDSFIQHRTLGQLKNNHKNLLG